jgi:hypothetical protein
MARLRFDSAAGVAHLLDRMATDGETVNWWERVTPRQRE